MNRSTIVVAFCVAIACSVLASSGRSRGQDLSMAEMAATRGRNPNSMKCSATCNNLNGYNTPCNGKASGDNCVMCNADPDLYYYMSQVTTPVPSGCTTATKGYQNDQNNNQQGCGFKSNGTCNLVGGGLACQNLNPTTGACSTAVEIDPQ